MSTKSSSKPRRRLLNLAVLAALGASALAPASASAGTLTWNCTNNFWDTTSCWLPNGTPTSADAVNVYTVGGGNTMLRIDQWTGTANASYILLDASAGTTVTLQQTGGSLSAAAAEYIGYGGTGTGTFNQSGGTNTIGLWGLYLGFGGSSNGSYNLSGTGSLSADVETIGFEGTGAFTQSGGTHTVSSALYLGYSSGSNGTYTLSGGTLNVGSIVDGVGTGTFNLDGGTFNFTGSSIGLDYFRIGNASGSNGSFTLGSGQTLTAGNETIGASGAGTFTQTGGTHTVSSALTLGVNSGSTGVYVLNGGTLNIGGNIVDGAGSSTFSLDGGTLNVTGSSIALGNFIIGDASGSNGSFTLGSGKTLTASNETIGDSGAGAFTQTGGAHTVSNYLTLGYGGTGTYNLSAGSLSAGSETIGYYGTGTFNQSGGTHTVGGSLTLGTVLYSNGSYNLSGGSLSADSETIGNYGTGTFTQSGGTHTVSNDLTLGNYWYGSGTYILNGGTLNVGGNIVDGAGSSLFNLNGGTLNVTGSSIALDSFRIGYAAGSNGSFTLGSGKTLTANYETIGYLGTGTGAFTQSGGTHTVGNSLILGYSGSGSYNLNAGSLSANSETIGYGGTGAFTQTGGTHTVSNGLVLGDYSIGNGSYTLIAGSLSAGYEAIGTYGTGTFTQSGGTNTVTNSLYLGHFGSGSNGSYNLSAGNLAANSEFIGREGSGVFTQSGGTNTASNIYLGRISGSNGSYNLSAGSLSAGYESIGVSGTGVFTQSGGTNTVTNSLTLGQFADGIGTYTLNGGTLNVGSLVKGAGTGSFNFNAGTLNIAGNLALDTAHPLSGVVLTGVKTLGVGGVTTLSGADTLTLDGGTFSTGSLVNNGGFAFNRGTFNLTGDNLTIGAGGLFGSSKQFNSDQTVNVTNTTTIASGSVLSLNNSAFSSGTTNNNGQIVLGGVISNLGGGTLNNAGRITGIGQVSAALNNMSTGEVRAAAGNDMVFATDSLNINNGRVTLLGGSVDFTRGLLNNSTGLISGRGTLATGTTAATGLINQGNLALSGTTDIIGDVANNGTGRIVVSGGATATFYDDVVHNGSEIRVSTGSQAVFFGAVSGAGAYTGTGAVFFEGDLRPGNSPALVSVAGDMNLGMFSHTTMELGGLARGAQYDAFDVGGTLSLGGWLDVVLYDLGGGVFAPHAGDSFDLFTAQTILGNFDQMSFAALSDPNLFWQIDTLADYVGTTDVVRLSVAQHIAPPPAVPEPETYAMLLAGLGLLGFTARRRKGGSRQAA